MPCNNKMGNGVDRDFPSTWAGMRGGGGRRDEGLGGVRKPLVFVFERKYMIYCVSLCKLKFVSLC